MLAHNKSPGRQNRHRPKRAKGASERARTRFGGQKSTFSPHERQPAERAALPLRKARRARKPHVGARPSFSPSAGCHPQRALRSPRPPLFAFRFASRRRAAESGRGCETGALRRLRFAPGAAAVALRLRLELQCGRGFATDVARFRHRTRRASSRVLRSANTAPINSVPRHNSRVSRPRSAIGTCADPPQHPSPARPRRRPRFGRESHAGCGTLGSPSRPHEARGTASSRRSLESALRIGCPHPQRRGGGERRNGDHVLAGRRATPPPLAAPFSEGARRASRTPALLL